MVERPIIFSSPMVRALLSGAKTQTRRIIKPQPLSACPNGPLISFNHGVAEYSFGLDDQTKRGLRWWRCPYGQPGDALWVRETYQVEPSGFGPTRVYYPADDGDKNVSLHHDRALMGQAERLWTEPDVNRPSIHMPRWASRITRGVTEVRVQRLQDIGEADALAEGVREPSLGTHLHVINGGSAYKVLREQADPLILFRFLWESIHGEGSWAANPFVWALSFSPSHQGQDHG